MDTNLIVALQNRFDSVVNTWPESDLEYWLARDLQVVLGYERWENFRKVLEKAETACQNSGVDPADHFREVAKMVRIGSGATRLVEDIMLTRYACYLIAQNGDSKKEQIAFAQSYFAIQTRRQELVEERIKLQERMQARQKLKESETELSRNLYERGVDDRGFGRIRSKGDAALFGGNSTQKMKHRLVVPKSRPLADFLPTVTITAKNLATEITNFNVRRDDLKGEISISKEHVQNNAGVRELLIQRGIKPEDLPPEEDLKKLERRVNSAVKKLVKESQLPPGNEDNE